MRLVGGEFLLNLTALSLDLTAGEVSISNEEVLSQLLELRNFIDEKRDFTKGFKDLKPVLVQYRSSASKIDGVVPCNLSFNTDALHLSIAGYSVQADGSPITLRINVVYEWTDYVGYTIKTAKLETTKSFAVDGTISEKYELDEDITISSLPENLTTYYSHARISNGKLNIVIAFALPTSMSLVATSETAIGSLLLSNEILDKLFPYTSDVLYTDADYLYSASAGFISNGRIMLRIRKASNGVGIFLANDTISAGAYTQAKRFEINFIL